MSERNGLEVAVIGMAGRFPQARDLEQLWRLLRDGIEAVSFFTDEELAAEGIAAELLADPNYVKAAAVLEGVELFDAAFFGITPREAEIVDPQQRLLLECACEALERAGYARQRGRRSASSPAPAATATCSTTCRQPGGAGDGRRARRRARATTRTSSATRLSYKLNLAGPSLTVQTACSTSLVAVHLACQSLLAGECEMALAGGGVGAVAAEGGLSLPGGRDQLARRALPRVRRQGAGHGPRAAARASWSSSASRTRWPTATTSTPSSRARRSTTTAA